MAQTATVIGTKPIALTPPACGAVLYAKIGNNKVMQALNEYVFGVHNGKVVSAARKNVPGVVNGTVVELVHASSFTSKTEPKTETFLFLPNKESYIKALKKYGFAPGTLPWSKSKNIKIFGFWTEFTATLPVKTGKCFAYSAQGAGTHNGNFLSWTDKQNKVFHTLPTNPGNVKSLTYNHWNIRKAVNPKTKKTISGQFEMVQETVTVFNKTFTNIGSLN